MLDIKKRRDELAAELDKAGRVVEQANATALRIQGALAMCDELIAAPNTEPDAIEQGEAEA